MDEQVSSRPYVMRKRADSVESTRVRITEAAVQLHETIGPARTTIAGIAAAAGVQRQTVYRHFPEEQDLLAACSAYYWTQHPMPEATQWQDAPTWEERVGAALSAVYEFYVGAEQMLAQVLRDADTSEAVRQSVQPYQDLVASVVEDLCAGVDGAPGLRARVAYALDFRAWRLLVRTHGVDGSDAVRAMQGVVAQARR